MQKTNSVLLVDRSRLKHNIAVLTAGLDDEKEVMAVIKSDAYGHGAVGVARAIEPVVDAFAVNDIHEAVELRKHGLQKSVLTFCPPDSRSAQLYHEYEITATVSDTAHFDMLPEGCLYHLNFDTGMSRFGFDTGQGKKVAGLVKEYTHLKCTGLYTHLATADVAGSEEVSRQQERFEEVRRHFPADLKIHIANTGGVAFYDLQHYDMVRLGIGIYGYAPGKEPIQGLQPALRWNSKLVAVKEIQKGESVSYGAAWQAPADGFIGIVPVGYEDGLKRGLTGKLSVRLKDKEYTIAGTITMNYCMVYLEDTFLPVGTEVELLYDSSNASDWARETGTIPYEILTGIGRNIPRKFVGAE